jgi:hypothetical protein
LDLEVVDLVGCTAHALLLVEIEVVGVVALDAAHTREEEALRALALLRSGVEGASAAAA